MLLPSLLSAAQRRWSSEAVIFSERLLDLLPERNSVILGTIFVDTPLKPNVLVDLENDPSLSRRGQVEEYISTTSTAKYYLEDEAGRIELEVSGVLDSFHFVTGSCVALKGRENSHGKFAVTDACYAGYSPISMAGLGPSDCNILFITGLSPQADDSLSNELLFETLKGNFWDRDTPKIDAVVIAGDIFGEPIITDDGKTKYEIEVKRCNPDPLLYFDQQLAEISSSLTTLIVPGPGDPTNCSLPQLPLKRFLLPKSSENSSLTLLSNPARFILGGIDILFESGKSLEDTCKYCMKANRITVADLLLQMRHIAPSAPDTLCTAFLVWPICLIRLGCYPFGEEDPFVLKETPRCFVIGNQPEFVVERKKVKCCDVEEEVLIVLLPRFAESKIGVILNSASLQCTQIQFH